MFLIEIYILLYRNLRKYRMCNLANNFIPIEMYSPSQLEFIFFVKSG